MAPAFFQHLDDEIICIDALYTGPENACCYLVGGAGEYALVETGTARSVANILATLTTITTLRGLRRNTSRRTRRRCRSGQ